MDMTNVMDWRVLMAQTPAGDAAKTTAAPAPAGNTAPAPSADAAKTGDAKPADTKTGDAKTGTVAPSAAGFAKTEDGAKTGPAADSGGGGTQMIIMVVLMVGLMVVMFILPARARKKQQKTFDDMYKNLKRDDRIMLQNGKFVTVERCEDDKIYVWGDTDRHVREVYHRNAVAMLANDANKDSVKKD
jgi:preprotein translocase subunit YajC